MSSAHIELRDALLAATRAFVSEDRTRVDYLSLANDALYERLKTALAGLDGAPIPDSRDEAIATWLNLHNALLIRGVIESGVTRTVRDRKGFDRGVWARIGPYTLSLSDLRYGVLGGNRRPPYRLRRPFGSTDPRQSLVVAPPEPRVRVALCDGTRSGPPLSVYDGSTLDTQLEGTARAFVNHTGGVMGCPGAGWVGLSPIFAWHSKDFGGASGVREFVAAHVESEVFAEALRAGSLKVRLLEYDWGLNKCVVSQ